MRSFLGLSYGFKKHELMHMEDMENFLQLTAPGEQEKLPVIFFGNLFK